MTNKPVYALLLAGGSGERLWPLSRKNKPKQLLTVEKEQSLLEDTIARIAPLIDPAHRWVITTAQHADDIAALTSSQVGLISVEPLSRNTGPAILLNCLAIAEIDPNAVVLVTPTDHYIADPYIFREFVTHAIDSSQSQEKVVLLGVQPTYPATGYGYIEYNHQQSFPCPVIRFHEKPTEEDAQKYSVAKNMLWNIGVFCAQVSVIIKEFEQNAKPMYDAVKAYWEDRQPYEQVPSQSIDYAVLEKSKNLVVLPVNFIWCDVGNLTTFLSLKERQKKVIPDIVAIDSHNNLINVEHNLVALIGIDNVCIVQTEDILLIAKRDETEKVKQVLEALKRNNADEYL